MCNRVTILPLLKKIRCLYLESDTCDKERKCEDCPISKVHHYYLI